MEKKYKMLLDDSISIGKHKLYRIIALNRGLCKQYSGSSFDQILLIKEEINYKGHWNKKDWSIYEQ